MEPTEALTSAEQALRLLVLEVLGPDWLTAAGAPSRSKLEAVRDSEARARPGVRVSDELIDFTYTKPLIALIEGNVAQFERVIDDVDMLIHFIGYIGKVRNTVAHARPLYGHERALLEGISGEIRTALTNFRMGRNDLQRHYATLETVVDNFGFKGFRSSIDTDISSYNSRSKLEVGDVITFDCRGWDGRGRAVEWMLYNYSHGHSGEWTPHAVGTNVCLTWEITERDVGLKQTVAVLMRNSGKFHLQQLWAGGYDGDRWFAYDVNPPPDA